MKRRWVPIMIVAAGLVLTAAGLGGRLFTSDETSRAPTFALDSAIGLDELSVAPLGGSDVQVSVLRAGQPITEFDEYNGVRFDVFVTSSDLNHFVHEELPDVEGTGVGAVTLPGGGEYRVVVQTAPADGPVPLELGRTIELAGEPAAADPTMALDEVWTGDVGGSELTITRQGFDFKLSEPWDGDDFRDGPAQLTLFRAGDLAFSTVSATTPADDRFRFEASLPGRGEYLAALQFDQGDSLVTALFRFSL